MTLERRAIEVWIPNVAGSTVLIPVSKLTTGATFAPPTEPRVSVCRCSRAFSPNLKLCAPFSQLRLLTI
jgi:hypothetical protein